MDEANIPLSFEDFKNSFSYGARSDLNFKFLKSLSDEEAADFIQAYFKITADSLNDGSFSRVHDFIYEWQRRAYSKPGRFSYDTSPFTPLQKPLSQTNLALISSSGHFVAGDDPQPFGVVNMSQEEAEDRIMDFIRAEPDLSEIPTETLLENLRVRHGGYDIRASQADANSNFPIERIQELAGEGMIGSFANPAWSFVGATSQTRLRKPTGPKWVQRFKDRGVEALLLVPV